MEQRLEAGQSEIIKSIERERTKKPVIVIMGVEGSGKSVHAELIAKKYNLPNVVMGDLFRRTAESDIGDLGVACRRILEEGVYADDELFWKVFDNRFSEEDIMDGVVIDGAFRKPGQVRGFKEKIKEYIGDADITVFFLRTPLWQGALRAIERGGVYDTEERILSRQKEFFRDLGERVALIKSENLQFEQIKTGNRSIEEVHDEIVRRYEEVTAN